MRLEDMSFTDYLMAECDLRERQRKERMKQKEFEKLSFPNTFDELVEQYGITDTDEVYTNGSKLIPDFRVKQWLMEANINGYTEGLSETVTEFADRCRECGKMRKGHWIYDETLGNWRCSKCNETPKTMGYVGTADFMAEHFKFCNHCGAKMESEV